MKKEELFGVGTQGSKYLARVKPNDLLVVHTGGLDGGVVGICRVTSTPFISRKPIWSSDYPHRVRIKVVFDTSSSPLSLSEVVGRNDNVVEVTPYLLGWSIIEMRPDSKIRSFLAKVKPS